MGDSGIMRLPASEGEPPTRQKLKHNLILKVGRHDQRQSRQQLRRVAAGQGLRRNVLARLCTFLMSDRGQIVFTIFHFVPPNNSNTACTQDRRSLFHS